MNRTDPGGREWTLLGVTISLSIQDVLRAVEGATKTAALWGKAETLRSVIIPSLAFGWALASWAFGAPPRVTALATGRSETILGAPGVGVEGRREGFRADAGADAPHRVPLGGHPDRSRAREHQRGVRRHVRVPGEDPTR